MLAVKLVVPPAGGPWGPARGPRTRTVTVTVTGARCFKDSGPSAERRERLFAPRRRPSRGALALGPAACPRRRPAPSCTNLNLSPPSSSRPQQRLPPSGPLPRKALHAHLKFRVGRPAAAADSLRGREPANLRLRHGHGAAAARTLSPACTQAPSSHTHLTPAASVPVILASASAQHPPSGSLLPSCPPSFLSLTPPALPEHPRTELQHKCISVRTAFRWVATTTPDELLSTTPKRQRNRRSGRSQSWRSFPKLSPSHSSFPPGSSLRCYPDLKHRSRTVSPAAGTASKARVFTHCRQYLLNLYVKGPWRPSEPLQRAAQRRTGC